MKMQYMKSGSNRATENTRNRASMKGLEEEEEEEREEGKSIEAKSRFPKIHNFRPKSNYAAVPTSKDRFRRDLCVYEAPDLWSEQETCNRSAKIGN